MSGTLYGHRRYLFILGHMRGYTSVLAHILGSNPSVLGYREHHISYDSVAALKRLRRNLESEFSERAGDHDYLLDKLLHNNLGLAPFVLTSPNVRLLFMLRDPGNTLRSLLAFFPQFQEAQALDYYISRLAALAELARSPDIDASRVLLLDAEALLDERDASFTRIGSWLGLTQGLRAEYRVFTHTGSPGHGDTSARLRSGFLHADRLSHPVALSTRAADQGARAYNACRATLHQCFAS